MSSDRHPDAALPATDHDPVEPEASAASDDAAPSRPALDAGAPHHDGEMPAPPRGPDSMAGEAADHGAGHGVAADDADVSTAAVIDDLDAAHEDAEAHPDPHHDAHPDAETDAATDAEGAARDDDEADEADDDDQLEAALPDAPTTHLEFIGGQAPRPAPGEAPDSVALARDVVANLLFAATQPLSIRRLSALLGGLTYECVRSLLGDVARAAPLVGLQVRAVAGGYQLATSPACAEWVWKLSRRKPEAPLSPAALETLAIVAYKQPVTKTEIDTIRGVESGAVVRHLVELELLHVAGRREVPGRPLIYKTTRRFLKMFGLARIADLPPIQDLKKLYRERERARGEAEQRAQAERHRAERDEALRRLQEDAAAAGVLPPPPDVRGPDDDDDADDAAADRTTGPTAAETAALDDAISASATGAPIDPADEERNEDAGESPEEDDGEEDEEDAWDDDDEEEDEGEEEEEEEDDAAR